MKKDPDARLDYTFNWSAWLDDAETIASYTLVVAAGDVVVDTDTELDGVVTAWLDAGTAGTSSRITCHIVTSAGREDDRTMRVDVLER